MLLALTALVGGVYPLVVTGLAELGFSHQANGSLVYRHGKLVGSSLLGQSFTNKQGDPLPQYFQPRPSDAGSGYDGASSSASNLGPSNPLLVGFIAGVNTVGLNGKPSSVNPFATAQDPRCVPLDTEGDPVIEPTPGERFEHHDGSYACDPNTVPERAMAYRQFNDLSPHASVPVDAVTVSGSGLDPDISIANALDQARRVAQVRHMSFDAVVSLVKKYSATRQLGLFGEPYVNVLGLNLALAGQQ
jgi:potassium-transporting ATPase KdpC subunit